jgi:hypothetical protein
MTHLRPSSAMIAAIGCRNQIPIPTPSTRKKRKPEITFSEVRGGSAEDTFVRSYPRFLDLFEACQIRAQKDF